MITHLIPGNNFDISYCVKNPSAICGTPEELGKEATEIEEGLKVDPDPERPLATLFFLVLRDDRFYTRCT